MRPTTSRGRTFRGNPGDANGPGTSDEADAKVYEKDNPPVRISDDQATGDGSEHGTDQTCDGDEAHGSDQFGLGKRSHYGESPTGTIMAPPQPCMMRHATNTWMLVDMPQRNDPSVKSPIAEANTRRVPNRSAIHALIGMKTASTDFMLSGATLRAAATVGTAVFKMSASMKKATATSTATAACWKRGTRGEQRD
jgi:hypothetical protein